MVKEIILYSDINRYSAENFIAQLEAAKNEDVVVRMNTNGGDPEYTYGMIAKLQEKKTGKTTLKIDGKAHSSGLFLVPFFDDVEALDVSKGLLHRAAYPSYIENDREMFTETRKKTLAMVNASAKGAFEKKVGADKFMEVCGCTLDDVFSMEGRKDILLTAQQLKDMNLVKRLIPLTPAMTAEIEAIEAIELNTNKKSNMATEKKEETVVSEKEIISAAVSKERDRILAWQTFQDVDKDAVKAGIESGKEITALQIAEFSRKQIQTEMLAVLEKGSPKEVKTEAEITAQNSEIEAFTKDLDAAINKFSKNT